MFRIVTLKSAILLAAWLVLNVLPIAGNARDTLEIIPAAPRYLEPVYLRWTPDIGVGPTIGAKVTMQGSMIDVQLVTLPELVAPVPVDVELGRFPAGTYTVRVSSFYELSFTVAPIPIGTPPFSTVLPKIPSINYSGHWWNPSESGWGLSIEQGPTGVLYAVWFVYGPRGDPVWYTFQSDKWTLWTSNGVSGPIFRTTGPYLAGTFDPTQVSQTQVGSGFLSFSNYNTGRFTYKLDGVTDYVDKAITRLVVE
jgi:hypothetical protein